MFSCKSLGSGAGTGMSLSAAQLLELNSRMLGPHLALHVAQLRRPSRQPRLRLRHIALSCAHLFHPRSQLRKHQTRTRLRLCHPVFCTPRRLCLRRGTPRLGGSLTLQGMLNSRLRFNLLGGGGCLRSFELGAAPAEFLIRILEGKRARWAGWW